ncbi:type I-E CRISPR-associated protein Cse2/CasB [Streptomyces sp. NPDC048248]|uniref:type I-E CRISPR-associated protein Cse2/CasB n=1 Tax=Streptomyces sp. NPDC048248 TaxID=3365523 RepID=UPI00371EA7B5
MSSPPVPPAERQLSAPERRAQIEPSSWLADARAFVSTINSVTAKDAGVRAALRSGVGKQLDDVPRMHRIVAPLLPGAVLHDTDAQRAFYTVAALIAAYHRGDPADGGGRETAASEETASGEEGTGGEGGIPAQRAARRVQAERQRKERFGDSLGLAYAAAVAHGGRKGIRESAAETRLNLLCKQSTAGLHRHLPAAVRQLCDRSGPPDWARLLVDLRNWPQQRRRVARWWLQDYYRARAAADLAAAREADDARSL